MSVESPVVPTLQKVRYTHEALIDVILANPAISQRDLAKHFGFTEGWMSIIINSDAFQVRLAERKGQLVDPKILASIEDRLEALGKRSLDKLLERVDNGTPISNGDLVRMAALGTGDRNKRPEKAAVENNLYVVNLPPPAPTAEAWLQTASRKPPGYSQVIENGDGGLLPVAQG